jgi:Tfp pilus assembly protein PilO
MPRTNQTVIAMLVTVAIAIAFWVLALSPKRQEASDLRAEAGEAKAALSQHEQEVAAALEARRDFDDDYRQLVVLGKAVPSDDATPSLLVQLTGIASRAHVRFNEIQLGSGSAEAGAASAPVATGGEPAPPTEVAASLLPLGASIGPAGLGIMPYTLKLSGNYTQIADFIKGLDDFVKSTNAGVSVDGRLLTINGFSLSAGQGAAFPQLEADFSVTTYLTPPGQGVTGGATAAEPTLETATPAAATIGGAP